MANLEQERAKFAWEKVQGCNSDYTKLAKAAPALIMNNGLMQALAFYAQKDRTALQEHIREWLAMRLGGEKLLDGAYPQVAQKNPPDYKATMSALLNCKPEQYRRATEEALALLRWIRQFAAANNSNS